MEDIKLGVEMKCALCEEGMVVITSEYLPMVYKGETFVSEHRYFRCNTCKEEYTTNNIDSFNLNEVYKAYNLKHPETPVELIE